jgi:hypothetical protein
MPTIGLVGCIVEQTPASIDLTGCCGGVSRCAPPGERERRACGAGSTPQMTSSRYRPTGEVESSRRGESSEKRAIPVARHTPPANTSSAGYPDRTYG